MGMVNLKRMANIAKHYRARFTTIVGIQPTGWTHTAGEKDAYKQDSEIQNLLHMQVSAEQSLRLLISKQPQNTRYS